MARDLFTNQASTTVSSGGTTAPAAGTTESWTVASSSAFPAASNSTYPATQFYVADPSASTELILVTNVSGTTWSVTRGADGTTPVAHTAGFTVKNVVPSAFLQNLADRLQQETYSVKDFGAKGDNANNDQPGIQAALDTAFRAGGGQVIVPKGIYRVMGGAGALRIRSNVRLTMLPGAEIHRYADSSSLVWNGDGIQLRGGWTGHGNFTVEGGVWDMRCSLSTSGCAAHNGAAGSAGTDAPVAGTSQVITVANNNGSPNLTWPSTFPFYVYDPAAPSEIMAVTDISTTSTTTSLTTTRGALSTTPVTHATGFTLRNANMALASDTFTRANTSAPHTLGVMDTGQTWIDEQNRGTGAQGTGGLGIISNTVYAPAENIISSTSVGNISTVHAWPDGSVSCTIPTVGTTGFAGVVFRAANSQQYWRYVRDNATGNAKLSYMTTTGLANTENVVTPTATRAVVAGETLKVVFYGNTIKAYVITAGGVATLTHDTTDTPGYTANRKVGLIISDTTSRLDTFESTASIWEDTFTRANSTTSPGATTSVSAMNWTEQQGNLGISASAIYAPSSLAAGNIATLPATQETNPEVIMSTAGNAGLVFRYKDNNNYWAYYRDSADNAATLIKVVNGSTTVLSRSTTQTVSSGNLLRVCVNGYSVRGYVGSVRTHDITDGDHYQEKNVGVIIYDATARLDNFKAVVSWGGSTSGACLNFGHAEQILIRDTTIRDTSANSHAVEIAGCKNVLCDNVTFAGMAYIHGRFSEAFQMDVTKDGSSFGSFGPYDNTTNRDVVVRGSSFTASNMPGTTVWQRGVGSHSSTIDTWHDHLRVTDNFFECSEKAVRAYNWNNVHIRGNTIRSGSGIEVRVPGVASPVDSNTINNAGVQTSASQPIANIQVEGNIVVCDYPNNSNVYAIAVFGVASGSANGVQVRGNDIKSSTCGGIWVQYANHVSVVSNMVNSAAATPTGTDMGYHGIRADNCVHSVISGNQVYRAGSHGIYVLFGSDIRVIGNYVRGASRTSAGASSCIKVDSSPDDVTITGNTCRPWGSGNEPAHGLHTTTGTNIKRLENDFVGSGTSGDVNCHRTGDTSHKTSTILASNITNLSSTTNAVVQTSSSGTRNGLVVTLNQTGTYRVVALLNYQRISGTSPTIRFGLNGPTASFVNYTCEVATAVGTGNNNTTRTLSTSYMQNTNLLTPAAASTTYGVQIQGTVQVTATGELTIQYACGGTSPNFTVLAGSQLIVERVEMLTAP